MKAKLLARNAPMILSLFLVTACQRQDADLAYPDAPVVFISIDTLRSDRLPAYGFSGVETPAIDALRRDSILFEQAYTHYPLTLPAHSSVMTGLLPPEHGVRDNVGYHLETADLPFLPRFLKQRGYATGGAVSAYILRADTGIGDDFDFYEDSFNLRRTVSLGQNQRPGPETARRGIRWLESLDREKFFLFLHFYEPHTPYEPPEPYASRYKDPYLGEIAAADATVGQVVAGLKRLGVYDKSIIVLFSDHGEGLSDHGEPEHGILLYREVLQVPLLVKLPGSSRAGVSVAAPAQLADIAPTVRALLGEEQQRTTLLDLLGSEAPLRPIYAETYYPRLHLGWNDLTSLIENGVHYIEGPDPELYDLRTDPGEKHNVLVERRAEYWALRDQMPEYKKDLQAPAEVDEETRERLAALGYLGSATAATEGPLPDPKTKLHVLRDMMDANVYQARREYEKAVASFERVLSDNPMLLDAWENMAQCLHHLSRYPEAIAAYEKALEISQGADHVALSTARIYLDMERYDDASRHAELALATNPAMGYLTLARIALASGDVEKARRDAQSALEARPNAVGPLLLLAQAAVDGDDLETAARHVAAAEKEEAKRQEVEISPGLHYLKGHIAARRGDGARAEASFLEEIRLHPNDTRVYSELALLYALEQKREKMIAILRQMVETNETPAGYAAAVETLRLVGDPRSAAGLLQVALHRFPGNSRLLALQLHE